MPKKVLVVLSGHGYWGEELIGPVEALDAAAAEIGRRARQRSNSIRLVIEWL